MLFTSSRSGEAAAYFDDLWWQRYGSTAEGATLKDRMPLAEARALLGLPEDHTRADILRAFRKAAFKAHPDAGGSAELFRRVVEARDRLLAALGMKAREVKMPEFAPKGRARGLSRRPPERATHIRLLHIAHRRQSMTWQWPIPGLPDETHPIYHMLYDMSDYVTGEEPDRPDWQSFDRKWWPLLLEQAGYLAGFYNCQWTELDLERREHIEAGEAERAAECSVIVDLHRASEERARGLAEALRLDIAEAMRGSAQ